MPSLIPGYSYDVFISYRHNDNRSGWVTEFVKVLKDELAATIKDPVTIYFDMDPLEGLHETQQVKETIDDKLRSFILIPILSQTYCDTRSYAFSHEFLPFHKLASEDSFGLKIKTFSGGVISRILPVRIHELDVRDTETLTSVLNGPVRGIDFIYTTLGVSRPLRPVEEEGRSNLNKTYYHDQVNKVARSVKEIIQGALGNRQNIALPEKTESPPTPNRPHPILLTVTGAIILVAAAVFFFYRQEVVPKQAEGMKSIAVLPFENMNKDSTQDYFTNGITEDILNHLTTVANLNVKSRTSTLPYKNSGKSVVTIGDELNVGHILEGSVRRVGDKVRIVVQLVDARKDVHIWSKTYDRNLKDVLAIQSEVAIAVMHELETTLSAREASQIKKVTSQNTSAYDLYLQARDIYNTYPRPDESGEDHHRKGLAVLQRAIGIDPTFSEAYALKAEYWSVLGAYGVEHWQDSANILASRAIELDSMSADGYIAKITALEILNRYDEAVTLLKTATRLAPGNSTLQHKYGSFLLFSKNDSTGADLVVRAVENSYSKQNPEYYYALGELFCSVDYAAAVKLYRKAISMDSTLAGYHYLYMASALMEQHKYKEAIYALKKCAEATGFEDYDETAWCLYASGDYDEAINACKIYKTESDPDMISYQPALAAVYNKLGRFKESKLLTEETLKIGKRMLANEDSRSGTMSHLHYHVAASLASLGRHQEAVQHLQTAISIGMVWVWGLKNNPQFDGLRNNAEFKRVIHVVDARRAFKAKHLSKSLKEFGTVSRLESILD